MCSYYKEIPLEFLDSYNIILSNLGVAQYSRYYYIPLFIYVIL
jgi:hypothetical protein